MKIVHGIAGGLLGMAGGVIIIVGALSVLGEGKANAGGVEQPAVQSVEAPHIRIPLR